jgi:hypothetical protein
MQSEELGILLALRGAKATKQVGRPEQLVKRCARGKTPRRINLLVFNQWAPSFEIACSAHELA